MSQILRLQRSKFIGPGLALVVGAIGLTPHKAQAGCSGDPKSPILVNVTPERGMTVSIGNLYKMVDKTGKGQTYSAVRCFEANDMTVSTALDTAVKNICDPAQSINVNFVIRPPTQAEFDKFCLGNGYKQPGLVMGPHSGS